MNRRNKERRRREWRYHGQSHRGGLRPGWLPSPAVGSGLAPDRSEGNARSSSCWPLPSRRSSNAAGQVQRGRPLYRRSTVAAGREVFEPATAASREAKPVALTPEHRRRRLFYYEVDACWPT